MLRYKQPEVISGSIVRFGVRSNLLQEKGDFTMLSLKRCLLIITLLCTLTVAVVANPGVTHAQTSSQQVTHTATLPGNTDMGIRSYWNGTLITLNIQEMRVLAAGGYAASFLITALFGIGVSVMGLSGPGAAVQTWNAANAYVHNQCYWFWVSTYKPDWGTYPCH
jgi:hypothetical protein